MNRRPRVVLLAVAAILGAIPVAAAGNGVVEDAATANEPAVRMPQPSGPDVDVVTIYNVGALLPDVASRALDASQAAGGTGAIGRSASTPMRRVSRGGLTVQQAPAGWAYPMATSMLPIAVVSTVMGPDVAAALSSTRLVMGEQTAGSRGARAGDVVDLVASNGNVVQFEIGAVVPDAITGGTELLLSLAGADRLGVTRQSRIVLWGFSSRAALDAELVRKDLISTSTRIRRSWDPVDPDSTLGMSATKAALGEFAYHVDDNDSVSVDNAWKTQHIRYGSIGNLTLVLGCHSLVRDALELAMGEVIASGLEYTIDYSDANRYGGCFYARFSRLAPNSSIGFLSRHSWGMAIDTNTQGSCIGCAPPDLDCRTVRIFRKHGFAWGGNFLRPDGMHFEWVGQRRDTQLYPSRFCPNIGTGALSNVPLLTQRATLFADDGVLIGD